MSDFSWCLDGTKFLARDEVDCLREFSERIRLKGVQRDRFRLIRNWFIVEAGLETGLRVMELAALRCGDLLTASSRPEVIVRRGKGGRRRVVKVSRTFSKRCAWFLRRKVGAGEPVCHEEGDEPIACTNRSYFALFP